MTRTLKRNSLLRHIKDMKDSITMENSKKTEEPYLSYHDIMLTVEDVRSLKCDWLTDNNISFWEEYLEHEFLNQYPRVKIILMRPSMVMMLRLTPDVATIKSALPDISSATHIFLPINDNPDPSVAEGGSHWSLLVVGVRDLVAFHYDSMYPSNNDEARLVSSKISELLDSKIRYTNLPDTPQQDNGRDCGVHVCTTMRHLLLSRLLRANSNENVNMSMAGHKYDCSKVRRDMVALIEKLRSIGKSAPQLPAGPPNAEE